MAEVALGEAGVLAAEFDLAGEGEVIAYEDLGPSDHGSWEGLVVTVSQADDPAVVAVVVAGDTDLKHAEVAGAIVADSMRLAAEVEASAGELFFDLGEQVLVGHGIPCLGVGWGWNFEEGFPSDLFGSAVKEEAGRSLGDDFWFK